MSELQRLKGLLPPEMQSWVFVEAAASADPPLITIEEIGRDEVEIQLDLQKWDALAIDHRNLLFWHEVGRIQNDAVPRDGWEMAALAIGLGGAALGKFTDFLGSSVAEARESEKVGKTTAQIIKATGGAAKVSAGQVGALAESLSEKAGVDDEVIQTGANVHDSQLAIPLVDAIPSIKGPGGGRR